MLFMLHIGYFTFYMPVVIYLTVCGTIIAVSRSNIMQVNFFGITFTVVSDNSFIFVHILAIPTCAYRTILKGICGKAKKLYALQQISLNLAVPRYIKQLTILKARKMGAVGDLFSEEKCTITKLLGIGRSSLEITKHLGRDHRTISRDMYDNPITAVIKAS